MKSEESLPRPPPPPPLLLLLHLHLHLFIRGHPLPRYSRSPSRLFIRDPILYPISLYSQSLIMQVIPERSFFQLSSSYVAFFGAIRDRLIDRIVPMSRILKNILFGQIFNYYIVLKHSSLSRVNLKY